MLLQGESATHGREQQQMITSSLQLLKNCLPSTRQIFGLWLAMVLDEATASIDSDTESRLQAALKAVMCHRTSLAIHTGSARSPRLIGSWFHRGRIESGSHHEVMEKRGVYSQLYPLQFPVGGARERRNEDWRATEGSVARGRISQCSNALARRARRENESGKPSVPGIS